MTAKNSCAGRLPDMLPDDSVTDIDDQILADVVMLAKSRKVDGVNANGDLEPAFSSYLDQLVRFATGEDQLWNEPAALLDRAVNAWKNATARKPGENKVALKTVGGPDWKNKRLVLDIVTETPDERRS